MARQIAYGQQRGLPWGISESGYNAMDVHLNYQYRAFGVPGLGLKRGLAEDLVVAPYATALALMVAPEAACRNLQRLAAVGAEGRFGFYEAIDYTPARQRRGESQRPGALLHGPSPGHEPARAGLPAAGPSDAAALRSPTRCSRPPCCCCRSASPGPSALYVHAAEVTGAERVAERQPRCRSACSTIRDTPVPEVHLLSNGRYHVMVTHAGGGYSRWKDLAVTRWREDATRDHWGTFCYLRDVASGATLVDRAPADRATRGDTTRRSSPKDGRSFAAATG